MGEKFLISEDERKHIKKLYGLLTEAVEPYTQKQKVTFESGYYGKQYAVPFLDPIIENIKKYLSDRPGERFVVNVSISSGESQIPNTDNEGEITGTKGSRLEPKQLATQRGVTIRDYLNEKLGELVKSGLLPSLPTYTIAEPKIGATPWVGTEFCPAGSTDAQQRSTCKEKYKACCGKGTKKSSEYYDKYQGEQYLDMSITITEEPKKTTEKCSDTIRIRFEIKNHSCQNAEFFVFANKTRLNNMEGGLTANLNTGSSDRGIPGVADQPIFPKELMNPGYGILSKKYGALPKGQTKEQSDSLFSKAARWDDFEIPLANKEAILAQSVTNKGGTPFINIWFECTTSDAHDDIVTITVYDGNNSVIVKPFSPTGKKEGLLCTLDKCGKPINTINGKVGPSAGDVDTARQELISYKSNLMGNLGLTADTSNLDTKGLELEKAGNLLTNINVVIKNFEEALNLVTSEFKNVNKEWSKIDEKTKKFIMSKGDTFNFVRNEKIDTYFQKVFDSTGYKSLLRKDPLDPESYRRGLITSDMGGDLKSRLDNFYKYFNTFYKLWDDGKIKPIALSSPEKYMQVNKRLSEIKGKS
jgi:hypothetical protein